MQTLVELRHIEPRWREKERERRKGKREGEKESRVEPKRIWLGSQSVSSFLATLREKREII
jgi:ribosomal protein L19E